MSEIIPSGNPEQASGEPVKDTVAHETHVKLLGEKKRWQAEAAKKDAENLELMKRLEEKENKELAEAGKWKELADAAQKRADIAAQKNLDLARQYGEDKIKNQFYREAEKLGCADPDLAMKAVSFDDLDVTDNLEFDSQKLVAKIQDLTKSKPFLFKKDFKLPKDVQPNNDQVPTKSISAMSTEELLGQYKQILQKK